MIFYRKCLKNSLIWLTFQAFINNLKMIKIARNVNYLSVVLNYIIVHFLKSFITMVDGCLFTSFTENVSC